MGLVGSLIISTQVQTKGLGTGFKKASDSVNGFSGSVKMAGTGVVALGIKLAAVLGPIIAIGKVISGVTESMSNLDRLGKFSDEVGLTVNELRGLQLGAELSGTDVKNLEKGMQRLTRRLGEARQGLGAGRAALEQLGIKAEDLTNIGTFDALKKVADQIKAQKTPAEQAAAAYGLFGRQGQEMLTFLNSGSEGMEQFVKRADELGGSLSRVDIREVEAANDAIAEIKFTFKSVFDQLAIRLAPFITAFVKNFQKLGFTGKTAGDLITSGLEFVAKAVAFAVDGVGLFKLAWLGLKKFSLLAVASMTEALVAFIRKLEATANKLPGVSISISKGIDNMAKSLRQSANDAGKVLEQELVKKSAGEKVTAFFNQVRADSRKAAEELGKNAKKGTDPLIEGMFKATEAAANLVQRLKDQIATFGMSSIEAEIFKLKQQGASQAILDQAKAAAKQLKALQDTKKAQDDLAARAKSVIDETKSPLDKFREKLIELKELFEKGLIGEDTFVKAIRKAQEGIKGTQVELPETKFAAAAEAGSSAARSAVLRNRFTQEKPMNTISENTKQQLKEMKVQTRILQRLEERQTDEVFSIN